MLKKKVLNTSFFQKLDSVITIQYPNIQQKESIDINADLLDVFLNDIDISTLESDRIFMKKYKYNLVPKKIHVLNYFNTIEIQYYNNCEFRLVIINYYETEEFSDEGNVSYSFKIENNQIKKIKRQEAG